ncbi:MAG: hypothetical protein ABEJ92_04395 [Halobacteriales archaeon]
MEVRCPYCDEPVDVTSLERHVRLFDGDGHGPHGEVPVEGVDNPWALRVDVDEARASDDAAGEPGDVPPVEAVAERVRGGWCPRCATGGLGLKGGDGFLARGRRRLACPHCGWESPEWVRVRQ